MNLLCNCSLNLSIKHTMFHLQIHSFIHSKHLYSASSRKLFRSAPNTSMVKQSSLKVIKNAGEWVLLKMRSSTEYVSTQRGSIPEEYLYKSEPRASFRIYQIANTI